MPFKDVAFGEAWRPVENQYYKQEPKQTAPKPVPGKRRLLHIEIDAADAA